MPIPYRLLSALMVGLSGAVVMAAMLGSFTADPSLVLAAGLGAAAAGAICAGLFGWSGGYGAALNLLGSVLTTFLGPALAALCLAATGIADPRLILYAPLMISAMILASPKTLLVWAATMLAAHLAMYLLRSWLDRGVSRGRNGCP